MSWSLLVAIVCVVAVLLTAFIVYRKYYRRTRQNVSVTNVTDATDATDATDSNTVFVNDDNFPEYDGKDGREVLSKFTAAYPNYRLEIVPPNALKNQEPDPQQQIPNPKRARMYVTQDGKVIRITIG